MAENLLERNLDLAFVPEGDGGEDTLRRLAVQAGKGHFHRAGGELLVDEQQGQRDRGGGVRHRQHGCFEVGGKAADDGREGEVRDGHGGHRRGHLAGWGGVAGAGGGDGGGGFWGGLAEEFFEDRKHGPGGFPVPA